jgi:hypothetical protein
MRRPFTIRLTRNLKKASFRFRKYQWILKRYRWRIGGFIALAVIVSSRLTPIYESTATVDVDRQTPSSVVSQDSARSVLNDSDQYLATYNIRIRSSASLATFMERHWPATLRLTGFHESIRTLRNSILPGSFDRQYRSPLVTSAAPGEGKTTKAANLATAHAEQGKRTLLIDGDLRRPSVHRNFSLPSVVGLSNMLLGEIPRRGAIVKVEGLEDLHIPAAGRPSRRALDLIGWGLAEHLQMATAVDWVIVVARAGQTSRNSLSPL